MPTSRQPIRYFFEFFVQPLDLRWRPSEQKRVMDQLGAEGWELRHMLQDAEGSVTAYFHRPAGKSP